MWNGFCFGVILGSSLSVSGRVQSASALNQRGVSYPPPSPRGLTRAQPVPQSRNPPLVKTRRLASVAGLINVNVTDSSNQQSTTVEATNTNVDGGDLMTSIPFVDTIDLSLLLFSCCRSWFSLSVDSLLITWFSFYHLRWRRSNDSRNRDGIFWYKRSRGRTRGRASRRWIRRVTSTSSQRGAG